MKFSCERCGKKYATADQPVPGRVYKVKCKACGHLIVVRSTGGSPVAPAPRSPPDARQLEGAAAPDVTMEVGTPEPSAPVSAPVNGATSTATAPLPYAAEPTQEVSTALAPEDEFKLKAGDTGYVDLFADAPAVADDPFAAAAQAAAANAPASLDADPFAGIRAELAAAEAAGAPRGDGSPPLPTPKVPDIPKPPPQKQGSPVLVLGGGAVVLVGILVFALIRFGGGQRAEPPGVAPTRAEAAQPAAPPPPAAAQPVEPAPQPAPVVKAEEPPRAEVRRERPEPKRRAERPAKPEPRPEPKAAQAPPPPAREQRNVDLPDVPAGLSDAQIQKVLSSTRRAFDDCIVMAGKKSDVKLDGRKVVLRLNIQPNGTVTYPTLDDVQLNATPLGGCLKQAARLMVFPKFSGDPLRIEVPLVLNEK